MICTVVVQYAKYCFYWIPHPRQYVCRHQDIYPVLTIAGDIVNLVIFGNGQMADHLKCIFCMFQHVVVVQYANKLRKVVEMFSEIASSHVTLFVVDT